MGKNPEMTNKIFPEHFILKHPQYIFSWSQKLVGGIIMNLIWCTLGASASDLFEGIFQRSFRGIGKVAVMKSAEQPSVFICLFSR
jgi:hypothetical protein